MKNSIMYSSFNMNTTYDYKNFLKEILEDLNENWVKAEIIEEKPWSGGL